MGNISFYVFAAVGALAFSMVACADTYTDRYIVVLKDNITRERVGLHKGWVSSISAQNVGIENEFTRVFNGYSGVFTRRQIKYIRDSDIVSFVEPNKVVRLADFDDTDHIVQRNAEWGLARTVSRVPLNSSAHKFEYQYNSESCGNGVHVYVVDTGVNYRHIDFEGRRGTKPSNPDSVSRVTLGKSFARDSATSVDGAGHGTHVASTIAGHTFGIAKCAQIVAVRVLGADGSGSLADVISGIEYVITQASSQTAVINLSLGGGVSRAIDAAVNGAVDAGVHVVVAAGNENRNACFGSPARAKNVISVGASDILDTRAWFSNFGRCVTLFAPGVQIKGAWIGSSTATKIIQGTSMAAPHVAGVLAAMLSDHRYSKFAHDPIKLRETLVDLATKNALFDIEDNTPNALLYLNEPEEYDDKFVIQ